MNISKWSTSSLFAIAIMFFCSCSYNNNNTQEKINREVNVNQIVTRESTKVKSVKVELTDTVKRKEDFLLSNATPFMKKCVRKITQQGYILDAMHPCSGDLREQGVGSMESYYKCNLDACSEIISITTYSFHNSDMKDSDTMKYLTLANGLQISVFLSEWVFKSSEDARNCFQNNEQLFSRKSAPSSKAILKDKQIYYLETASMQETQDMREIESIIIEQSKSNAQ